MTKNNLFLAGITILFFYICSLFIPMHQRNHSFEVKSFSEDNVEVTLFCEVVYRTNFIDKYEKQDFENDLEKIIKNAFSEFIEEFQSDKIYDDKKIILKTLNSIELDKNNIIKSVKFKDIRFKKSINHKIKSNRVIT
jgi:hypothetical protein